MKFTSADIPRLFATRIVRLFCYGFLSVVLALYLAQAGLDEKQIGLLFTLTLAGDAGITLWLTISADRFGRKRTLLVGAVLMIGAGVVFILTKNPLLLMVAAIIGRAKTAAYVGLVAVFSIVAGFVYGAWVDGASLAWIAAAPSTAGP